MIDSLAVNPASCALRGCLLLCIDMKAYTANIVLITQLVQFLCHEPHLQALRSGHTGDFRDGVYVARLRVQRCSQAVHIKGYFLLPTILVFLFVFFILR